MIPIPLIVALTGCSLLGASSEEEPAPSEEAAAASAPESKPVEAEGTFGQGKARLVLQDGVMSLYATDLDGNPIEPAGGVMATVTPVSGTAERVLLEAAGDHWEGASRADGSPALVVLRWETAEGKTVGSVTVSGPLKLPQPSSSE
ncbi:MAG: hypothetical protein KTR31_24545 [Myxococcales bacterium]|nr:hypothetical protein [Myxococcales bacterium]